MSVASLVSLAMTRRADELTSREVGPLGRDPRTSNIGVNNVQLRINKKKNSGCTECNSQICSSYVVGLLACLLIIGGLFLAFQRWDYMWLVVTLIGIVLTFVG